MTDQVLPLHPGELAARAAVAAHIDAWLAGLFDPDNIERTIAS